MQTVPDGARVSRVASVDVVRGAVIVLMALDHVRDYVTELRFPPENLARASAALFMTRWVTHFCAPAFFLLAGIGIALYATRAPEAEVSRFLVTRGLWLLVVELVITPVGWQFGFDLIPAIAIVIWALGWSMIIMAGLVHLPRGAVLAISLLTIGLHNLFDGVRPADFGSLAPLWHVLHVPGFAIPGKLIVAYPLIPWFAVMALGYSLGALYQRDERTRRRVLIGAGVAATLLFVALRAVNAYGNPFPWTEQRTPGLTVSSFLNVTKYPPSLQFLLMTLGPTFVALALLERVRNRFTDWLAVYGRVPFFFYVGHIFVAHAVGVALAFAQGGVITRIPVVNDPGAIPPWFGVGLPGVYLAWAAVVLLMYFPCRRFDRMKRESSRWWLTYL